VLHRTVPRNSRSGSVFYMIVVGILSFSKPNSSSSLTI
jgi:hypothetical protein